MITDLLDELSSQITQLGDDGGRMSASVYDSAQALRLASPSDPHAVVQWLLGEQRADGGWGDALEPLARLRSLYLWRSGVTATGARSLAERLPRVRIDLGMSATTIDSLRAAGALVIGSGSANNFAVARMGSDTIANYAGITAGRSHAAG